MVIKAETVGKHVGKDGNLKTQKYIFSHAFSIVILWDEKPNDGVLFELRNGMECNSNPNPTLRLTLKLARTCLYPKPF